MKGISIVLNRDFREIRRTNAFRVLVIVCAVITLGIAAGTGLALYKAEWLTSTAARPLLETIMGLIVYFLPFSILMAFIWVFASLPIIKEKANGNIDSLLATPLSPRAVWIGKSLAIFLPGFVISVVSILVVIAVVHIVAIVPATGYFFLPATLLLTGFIVNPLLFFGLLSFIILFSMAFSPDIAIMPSFLVGFGLMIGIPVGVATGTINIASWSFTLWYLAAAVIIWAVVLYLTRFLTREQVVLSGKGN